MPQQAWNIIIGVILFLAAPSLYSIILGVADKPIYDNYPYIPSILRLMALLLWVADWGGLFIILIREIKKSLFPNR
jgi:hypothetical protein